MLVLALCFGSCFYPKKGAAVYFQKGHILYCKIYCKSFSISYIHCIGLLLHILIIIFHIQYRFVNADSSGFFCECQGWEAVDFFPAGPVYEWICERCVTINHFL